MEEMGIYSLRSKCFINLLEWINVRTLAFTKKELNAISTMCRKHLSSSLAKLGLPPSVPAHLVGPGQFTKTSQLCQSPHTLCSGSFNFSGKSLMDFLTREMNQSLLEVLDGISWSK